MRTLLTFDYEIFFGKDAGTAARSVIEPTEALLRIAKRRGAKLVFFVDAGFITRMRDQMKGSESLRREHDAVCRQVASIAAAGHEVQLHVHPHWEDSHWRGDAWRLDLSRFALHAFSTESIRDIFARYTAVLRELAGPDAAFAYRAGGWVIQPFAPLRGALLGCGVRIDSTVFHGGKSSAAVQPYDFESAPRKSRWRFDADPLVEKHDGPFLEVPIAHRKLDPGFFWRFACAKKLGGARHRAFGDGHAVDMDRRDLVRKLTRPSHSVVSADGFKASFLAEAARAYRAQGIEDFVVIGHPKAQTPYSLEKLDDFLAAGAARETAVYADYR